MKKTSSFRLCQAAMLFMTLGQPLKLHGAVPDGILHFHISKEIQYATLDTVAYQTESVRPYFHRQGLGSYCETASFCGSPYLEIRGMAVIGADLYGIEQVAGTGKSFLAKANDALVFVRVAPSLPLGNTPVGALVWTGDKLIAAAAGTDPGKTTLLEVSPVSGEGVPLNLPALNIAVGGMAFDPGTGILYASSKVTEPPDRVTLYRINLSNGGFTEIGPVTPGMFGLAWIAPLGLVGLSDRVYLIDPLTAEAIPVVSGPEYFTEPENRVSAVTAKGSYVLRPAIPPDPVWGADFVPVQPEVGLSGGKLKLSWVSRGKSNFSAYYSPDLNDWNWTLLEDRLPFSTVAGVPLQYEFVPPPGMKKGFYHLYEYPRTATGDAGRLWGALLLLCGAWGVARCKPARRSPL